MSAVFAVDDLRRLREATLAGAMPDAYGRFGPFGGCYVPEILVPARERLQDGVK
jgi:hypothetical protein